MAEIDKIQPIQVERAKEGDARAIQDVIRESWLASFSDNTSVTREDIEEIFKNADTDEFLGKANASLARPPENEKYFVAKEGARIVGFCQTTAHVMETELGNIYTSGGKRAAAGTSLWNEVKKVLDRQKDTFIWAPQYDMETLKFYESLGFAQTKATRPDPRLKSDQARLQVKMLLPKEHIEKVYI